MAEKSELTVNVRSRDKHLEGSMPLENFIDKIAPDNQY